MGAGVALSDILDELRPGDIVTHCYRGDGDATIGDTILNRQHIIRPEVHHARQQGILFDVGHGGGSFLFETAKKALAQDFLPDVISTDIHSGSINDPVYSLPETASKLLNLGIELPDIVRQTTTAAAAAIGRSDHLGTLKIGTVADLSALKSAKANSDSATSETIWKSAAKTSIPYSPSGLAKSIVPKPFGKNATKPSPAPVKLRLPPAGSATWDGHHPAHKKSDHYYAIAFL